MNILIPTYGRTTRSQQVTLQALVAEGLSPILVVQHREHKLYDWYGGPVHVLPLEIQTIVPTREYLIHSPVWDENYCIMLDDDLYFYARRSDARDKLRELKFGEVTLMLAQIKAQLEIFPHVGIASREGANRNTEDVVLNTRIMRVLGYRRSFLREHGVHFTPMEVMEDFHVSLQILKKGYDICVLNNWASNQAGGSGSIGGCSTFRTPEMQGRNAHLLADLHAPYVKVVEKTTKGAWGGGTRTDVMIQWKKARAHNAK